MARRAKRAEDLAHELVGGADERIEQPPVGLCVRAEPSSRIHHGALHHHRGAVVEGVGKRRGGMRQLEPVLRGAAVLLIFWSILYWMYRRKIFIRI